MIDLRLPGFVRGKSVPMIMKSYHSDLIDKIANGLPLYVGHWHCQANDECSFPAALKPVKCLNGSGFYLSQNRLCILRRIVAKSGFGILDLLSVLLVDSL
jgi:hypothetical protein